MSEHLTREQIAELAEAVKNRESFTASGMHINYGESHDYMAGWNAGYDDNQACEAYDAECVARMAPELEPNRAAYIRGYNDGWKHVNEGETDD